MDEDVVANAGHPSQPCLSGGRNFNLWLHVTSMQGPVMVASTMADSAMRLNLRSQPRQEIGANDDSGGAAVESFGRWQSTYCTSRWLGDEIPAMQANLRSQPHQEDGSTIILSEPQSIHLVDGILRVGRAGNCILRRYDLMP